MNRFIKLLVVAMLAIPSAAMAQVETKVIPSDSTSSLYSHSLRRQNRGVSNLKTEFVPKGQWVFGGSVSYSTHNNNNYNFLIIEDIESNGGKISVKCSGSSYRKCIRDCNID